MSKVTNDDVDECQVKLIKPLRQIVWRQVMDTAAITSDQFISHSEIYLKL